MPEYDINSLLPDLNAAIARCLLCDDEMNKGAEEIQALTLQLLWENLSQETCNCLTLANVYFGQATPVKGSKVPVLVVYYTNGGLGQICHAANLRLLDELQFKAKAIAGIENLSVIAADVMVRCWWCPCERAWVQEVTENQTLEGQGGN